MPLPQSPRALSPAVSRHGSTHGPHDYASRRAAVSQVNKIPYLIPYLAFYLAPLFNIPTVSQVNEIPFLIPYLASYLAPYLAPYYAPI